MRGILRSRKHDVGQKFFHKRQGFHTVAGLRNDAHILFDFHDGNNSVADDWMIIRDQNSDFGWFHMVWFDRFSFLPMAPRRESLFRRWPGFLISILPPMRWALSRMVVSP